MIKPTDINLEAIAHWQPHEIPRPSSLLFDGEEKRKRREDDLGLNLVHSNIFGWEEKEGSAKEARKQWLEIS